MNKRILIEVAYDGTNYHGWQYQEGLTTVEGVLNNVLSDFFNCEIKVIGASRTDAGVHADGNVAVFDVETRMPAQKIPYAINRRLPDDIRIVSGKEVPLFFHPRKTETEKTYEYRIISFSFSNPTKRLYAYQINQKLDIVKMNSAAELFLGEHDFAGFCSSGNQTATTIRTIYRLTVVNHDDEYIITVTGNGFLYNMVRIIAGTLIEVGLGRLSEEDVKRAINDKDRRSAGPTAPAHGLKLVKYHFPVLNYGLLGEKLAHSYSVEIHNKMGNENYSLIEIQRDKLEQFIGKRNYTGLNVTIPYKETVIGLCDEIDEVASQIGSINTIVNDGECLKGYNTDYLGFMYMAKCAGIEFKDKSVLILGTGGTSKTAGYCCRAGAAGKIRFATRNRDSLNENTVKALTRYGEILEYSEIDYSDKIDIVINTSPVGMYPNMDAEPIDICKIKNLEGVLDVIYNPLRTNLLIKAKQMNVRYSCGLPMLVAQAYYAERLFMGKTCIADGVDSEIKNLLTDLEKRLCNIVLVGMPGSGKTTLGKLLADKQGMPFMDTDKVFEQEYMITPAECIKVYGENDFRDKEGCIIKKVLAEKGVVIATGGGSILRQENRLEMMRNATIVYISRDIEKLSGAGRPLSSSKEKIRELYNQRKDIYEGISDYVCTVTEDKIKNTCNSIIELLNARNMNKYENTDN